METKRGTVLIIKLSSYNQLNNRGLKKQPNQVSASLKKKYAANSLDLKQ